MTIEKKRVGIYGWGVVAPRSPNIERFEENLARKGNWLDPFHGFGPNNFLVGTPEFDFAAYKPWIDERFEPRKFAQLESKMGDMAKFAIGAFIQSLSQNPGIERVLQELGEEAHIYVGTGLGDVAVTYEIAVTYDRAQRRWNRFWCHKEHNQALVEYLSEGPEGRADIRHRLGAPDDPRDLDPEDAHYEQVEDAWLAFWAEHSEGLAAYLTELKEIEAQGLDGDIETEKGHLIRRKQTARRKLNKRYGCPEEPWNAVDAKLLWNIPNIPAAQISMLGKITGTTLAPVAACSGFGTALMLAHNAIQLGQAKACVVGMTDPAPHQLTVAGFYRARIVAQDGQVSKPFTGLRGTHVSGGACIWIVGDASYFRDLGMQPLGLEIVGVANTSDADHIITPSEEGPRAAINRALDRAEVDPDEVATWDMHATATPGDWTELQNTLSVFPGTARLTARKGSFGHGMSVCGGWELTAQHLGFARGELHPIDLVEEEIHPQIRAHSSSLLIEETTGVEGKVAGKLNMGVGGVNACVISRAWEE